MGSRENALTAYCLTPTACSPTGLSMRRDFRRALANESNQVERAISTGKLHALPRFHIRPIDVVVFHGSSRENWF